MILPTELSGVSLPAAFVDLDAFDRNVEKLLKLSGGKKIRLATKSIRVPDMIRRALDHSPRFQGLMCYSAQEARFLAEKGFDDFLIAYPTVQPADLLAIRTLLEKGIKLGMVVDSRDQLEILSSALRDCAKPLSCVVEVDLSLRAFGGMLHLGVRRSPIRTPEQLQSLLRSARNLPGIQVVGLMAYEAQVAGFGDRNPFKKFLNPVASLIRKISVVLIREKRARMAKAFRETGMPLELFNGGGTGSINFAAQEPALTEVTAGSALFCPHLFDYYSNVRFEPAVFFALQIVRASDEGFVTCQGGGYIASGEPGWDRLPLPISPKGAKFVAMEGCGEVQTPVRLPAESHARLGGAIWFRHAKAGELAERFPIYHLLRGGKIVGTATTYRGFGECYF